MGLQIEALAQFVAQTRWEDIPEPVQRHAKLEVLDTLGVILAGAERPEVRELRGVLAGTAGTGATVLARGWPAHDPRTAALLNGIAGRSVELCEGLRFVSGQAAMQVLPGVLRSARPRTTRAATCSPALSLGYDLVAGWRAASRLGPWRTRTARWRWWRLPPRERGCAGSMRPGSAGPRASRPRWC